MMGTPQVGINGLGPFELRSPYIGGRKSKRLVCVGLPHESGVPDPRSAGRLDFEQTLWDEWG